MSSVAQGVAPVRSDMTLMRLNGRVAWVCKRCSAINVHMIRASAVAVRCSSCERVFGWGLYELPRGLQSRYQLRDLAHGAPEAIVETDAKTVQTEP